ncbi:MAG: hypothetical protein V4804_10695 [Pseudomonadota bacterium]|jgi:hypothetical protein
MRIVYHLGAHCTDDERLLRCLIKNRAAFGQQGIVIPDPARYRTLLRDTAITLKGQAATRDMQALVLEQVMEEPRADRLILSWDNFLSYPQWVLRDRMYPAAAERVRAFTQIFPEIEAEFHLAIRNPATFVPALFNKQRGKTYDEFVAGIDLMAIRWSEVISSIRSGNPDGPLTVWCDEDTPLIWPEVVQAVSGHSPDTQVDGTDELLATIMSPDGMDRMRAYLNGNRPGTVVQRRRVVSAFLDKFARPEQIDYELDLPGWTQDMVDRMTDQYQADIARISAMQGVNFLTA